VQCSICGILTTLFLVQSMQCGSGKGVKGSGLGVLEGAVWELAGWK
jgi:hypothetical protein